MKIAFVQDLKMSKANKVLLGQINSVIDEYAAQNYKLSLRQLYYQLVTKNIIANKSEEYDKLSNLMTKGRMAGIIDWDAIVDRIRVPRLPYWNFDIEDAISDAERNYRLNRQKDQHNYIEIWVEKDALSEVLSRKTYHYHVNLMVNRGYSSTTAMFDAYNRFKHQLGLGKTVTVLYLGDHDPSGLDMVRDIRMRILRMLKAQPRKIWEWYSENYTEEMGAELQDVKDGYVEKYGYENDVYELLTSEYEDDLFNFYLYKNFQIKQIALTTEQVRQYNPPPNPAKLKDPRSQWYVANFGTTSWEVDALNPIILHEIIDREVKALIDNDKFDEVLKQEEIDKGTLHQLPVIRTEHTELKTKVDGIKSIINELGASGTQKRSRALTEIIKIVE